MSGQSAGWPLVSPALVAIAYFLGSLLGLSLPFPSTEISVYWPPNAILLAALLVTPRRRWGTYLLAVLPAHVLAQWLVGLAPTAVVINFIGNTGDALLGAWAIDRLRRLQPRFDRLRIVLLIMLVGGVVAPAVMSFVVAQLFVASGATHDPWLNWRLRLLNNCLAVLTLVPPIVFAARRELSSLFPRGRRLEWLAVLVGVVTTGVLAFGLIEAGPAASPLLLYAPLPFLLWAAMRFGIVGTGLSVLALSSASIWNVVRGHGPFTLPDPVQNATSLMLFLDVTCALLLMLAALIEERESRDREGRSAAALHAAVLASMHDQIAILDHDGVIREVNQSWSGSGRSHPGSNFVDELRFLAAAGPDPAAGELLAAVEAVMRGQVARLEIEVRRQNAAERWFEFSVEGLRRTEGGAVITYADVTMRKQAEEEMRLQRQELAHLTRVAMLGELSGALAHELNQPLTAILSNAQAARRMLAQESVDLAEVREIVSDIADNDRRAGEVIQRLRAMLRKGETRMTALDVNAIVREGLRFAQSELMTRHVIVATDLGADLRQVLGDRVQLQQVLLNLILNACEAMGGNPISARRLTVATAADGAGELRVAVVDNGSGIAAEDSGRIFEPFFTTKSHGLGLGLPICRSIVEAHGGRLWAANNEERGATFFLTLPGAQPEQA